MKIKHILSTLKKSKVISWLSQLCLFALIFLSLSWFQQKDMLRLDEQLMQTNLNLLSVQGEAQHFDLANGKTNTLIYFFAPWCKVCHASIDNLEAIYQTKAKDLNIIVIALDWRSINQVDEFLAQHQLSMPVLLGTNEVSENFKIGAFPSYYLISKRGEVKSKNMGYTTELGMNWRLFIN